jgi:hypothetical protein
MLKSSLVLPPPFTPHLEILLRGHHVSLAPYAILLMFLSMYAQVITCAATVTHLDILLRGHRHVSLDRSRPCR